MIYLDNCATTPIKNEVYESMIPYLTSEYGNPSGKYYDLATSAKKAVEQAREHVAKLIEAKAEEIIFTSGATESINMVIKGVSDYKKYYENRGNHIITSKVEHKATINTCKFLNGDIYSNNDAIFFLGGVGKKIDRGYEVTFLDVNEFGQVTKDNLKSAIKDTTTIVSIIWGNNEIGTINDVFSLSEVCHENDVLFHTDATQVLGKIDVNVKDINVDFMSLSAHKVYGPKGIGAVYIKTDEYGLPPFSALLHGGEQEYGMRGSTSAVHNIVGFGKAAEIALRDRKKSDLFYHDIDQKILNLIRGLQNISLVANDANRLPGIYSILVNKKNFNNEIFIRKIAKEIAVSSGSACTAGKPSHVLQAIGLGDYTGKVIRISIGNDDLYANTFEKIKELLYKIDIIN
jgi:cysteine desulfurase